MLRKIVRGLPWVLLGLFVLLQVIPYGRDHTNPPVVQEPSWDSPRTRELAKRACFDCHSNETHWPWYASIAPLSWSIQDHVVEGREHLNFSEWNKPSKDADEAAEEVEKGKMPLRSYLWLHPEARLTETEKGELIEGLVATFGRREEH